MEKKRDGGVWLRGSSLTPEIVTKRDSSLTLEVITKLESLDIKADEESAKGSDRPSSSLPPSVSIKRKLLILDVNGLLADVVMPPPPGYKPDAYAFGRAIFKRPFCDDFLGFCIQNFDVGLWSSRAKKNLDAIVPFILGNLKGNLVFCLDSSHCTLSGFNTIENRYKPLVFKDLRRIWDKDVPFLTWDHTRDYNESNTLLMDDSPYKALLNPVHTAIFPTSYHHRDRNDSSLGPGGDLRRYLEGLLEAENVPKYVEKHPFGKRMIDENDKDWSFYSRAVQNVKGH